MEKLVSLMKSSALAGLEGSSIYRGYLPSTPDQVQFRGPTALPILLNRSKPEPRKSARALNSVTVL